MKNNNNDDTRKISLKAQAFDIINQINACHNDIKYLQQELDKKLGELAKLN